MEFGLKRCGALLMKRGKKVRFDGITLLDGPIIREEGYKNLGILEVDMMREKEMKKRFAREYKRRLRLVLKSKLNGIRTRLTPLTPGQSLYRGTEQVL